MQTKMGVLGVHGSNKINIGSHLPSGGKKPTIFNYWLFFFTSYIKIPTLTPEKAIVCCSSVHEALVVVNVGQINDKNNNEAFKLHINLIFLMVYHYGKFAMYS